MTLRLNGSTSGYTEIDAPAVAANNTLTLPSLAGGTLVATDATGSLGAAVVSSLNGGPIAGSRNRIINGGFDIWQRGTSQTTTGYGSADRWNMTVAGTTTFSQETSIVPSGAQYALKWTTGAASSYGQVRQYIEQLNVIPLRGQTVTASAYVRSGGTFTGNYLFEIGYNTSSDASGAGWSLISTTTSGTINSSSYTQIKATFTVPSNAVGLYFGLVPDTVQASGAIVYQSLAQLEPGSTATPFERRPLTQEQILCARYYHTNVEIGTLPNKGGGTYFDGVIATVVNSGTSQATMYRFPVPMRAAPTITLWSPNNGAQGQAWSETTQTNLSYSIIAGSKQLYSGSNPTGSGISGNVYYFHYAASAEL